MLQSTLILSILNRSIEFNRHKQINVQWHWLLLVSMITFIYIYSNDHWKFLLNLDCKLPSFRFRFRLNSILLSANRLNLIQKFGFLVVGFFNKLKSAVYEIWGFKNQKKNYLPCVILIINWYCIVNRCKWFHFYCVIHWFKWMNLFDIFARQW